MQWSPAGWDRVLKLSEAWLVGFEGLSNLSLTKSGFIFGALGIRWGCLALVWGDSPDICVTFLEASSSLITCWDVRGLSSQSLPGPRRPHRSWDKRMSASGWNWKVVRKGKPDSRLGQDHCWSCRPEIRMRAPESFWLKLSVITSSLQSIFVNIFFTSRVLSL